MPFDFAMSRRVLIAFDKFKESLAAERACAITAREIRRLHPDWQLDLAPITDGGDGFCRILTEAAGGTTEAVSVSGPRMETVRATLGLVEFGRLNSATARLLFGDQDPAPGGKLAVIELAEASGLALIPFPNRDPWHTSTYGTGQMIRAAAELGAEFILLGIGGSGTSDLGLGALSALGLEFRDETGDRVRPPFPDSWERISQIEGEVFSAVPPIAIACDVSNPLLGPNGAAATYGPQKGLKPDDVSRLDALAERVARILCAHCEIEPESAFTTPGAGAAGGISFGLSTAHKARLVPGFELVSTWLDLEKRVAAADLVITGEGRFDRSSLSGKGPGAIVALARKEDRDVLIFAGMVEADEEEMGDAGEAFAITPSGTPLSEALARANELLAAAIAGHFS